MTRSFTTVALLVSMIAFVGLTAAQAQSPQPQPIQVGENIFGALTTTAPTLAYSFSGRLGASVTVQVLELQPGLSTTFRVVNSQGFEVVAADNPTHQSAVSRTFVLTDNGSYRVEVSSASGMAGSFVLSVLEAASASEVVELTAGQRVDATVNADDPVRLYRISALPADPLLFHVHSASNAPGITVTLNDDLLNQPVAVSTAYLISADYLLPAGFSIYTVQIQSTGSTPVETYSLCLESAQIPGDCAIPQDFVHTAAAAPTLQPMTEAHPYVLRSSPGNVNVRAGDGVGYRAVGALRNGEQAEIVGVSAYGIGWLQIRLPNGTIGWISSTTVDVVGDLSTVPQAQPPAAQPIAQPTQSQANPSASLSLSAGTPNLVAGIVEFSPGSPVCAQTLTVGFDVANLGAAPTTSPGTVSLVDTRVADGSVQAAAVGSFPILNPGQTYRSLIPLTVTTWYNETHRITLRINPAGTLDESTQADNIRIVEYTLAKGSCP